MKILHFEYSDFFRRVVHDMALRLGYDYIGTSNGDDLFKILAKHDIDVIFTGMELSDMSAESLISNIKSSKFDFLPIVILTSSEIADIHKRLKGIEFSDFIVKENLTIQSLKKCVNRFEKI
ncbi:response regulator [Fusibacter bizertensis]|uniref:Stage 0 sporulation protein A homolog n=1 Tax=Fusibacter bizertensis TaxID=1488331 RepID=A0ABT6NAV6_9FIRM|nr:response regulator [Fusibacter bizertensis]MDH8677553.1 response regulator [Fusibacter bizertensis]